MNEVGTMSFLTAPFQSAALLGAQLGANFRNLLEVTPQEKTSLNGVFNNALANFGSEARFFQILPSEINAESVDDFVQSALNAKPIKFLGHNGYSVDLFSSSDVDGVSKDFVGELSDPYSGNTMSFNSLEEFLEVFKKLEQERKVMMQQRAKMDLLLASAGDPASIESIYNATAPDKNENPEAYAAHLEEMNDAVEDAVKSHLAYMNLNELKDFAGRYFGLDDLIRKREDALKKLDIGIETGQNLTGFEIEKLQEAKDLKYSNIDVNQLANKIDKLSDPEYQSFINKVNSISSKLKAQNFDRTTPATDFGIIDIANLEEEDRAEARNLLDWFDNLDIA